jgi:effector-binding domain-containing protein
MIDTPHIVTTTPQHCARIHLTIPRGEIQNAMGPGISEVMGTVAVQGIAITGPWFTHHLKMDPQTFDFEICVPVASPVTAAGRVTPGVVPALTVARTIYQGNYEGLGAAWGEFMKWIAANGHTAAEDLYETYLKGPESSSNPADWRTEFNRPLVH